MKITDQIPAMQTLPHRAKAVVNFLSASILKVLKYSIVKVEVKSVCKQTVCLHFELLYFFKI